MREVKPIRSIVSLLLVFFLLVPVSGALCSHCLHVGFPNTLQLKKLNSPGPTDTSLPSDKEEENRSEDYTHKLFVSSICEYVLFGVYQHNPVSTIHSPGLVKGATKIPLYLTKQALLI